MAHYQDGTTVIEDRKNGNHWFELPKNGIKVVGVQLDPRVLAIDIKKYAREDAPQKIHINFKIPEHILPGSGRHANYWIIDKGAAITIRRGKGGKRYPFMRITNIRNAKGECTCKEVHDILHTVSYSTNVYSLGFEDGYILRAAGVDMAQWRREEGR